MKYIDKVGVELEGGWHRRPNKVVIARDQSVRVPTNHSGEINSPPFRSLDELEEWIRAHRPDMVDYSCGFHIHVSFKSKHHYMWLTTRKFYQLVLKRFRAWAIQEEIPLSHHFWKRWRGTFRAPNGRNFCRKEFVPEKQLFEKEKGRDGTPRHCHLNYCWLMHGTLELRLPPAWEPEVAHRYMGCVRVFTQAVEDFLSLERKEKVNNIRIKIEPLRKKRRSLVEREVA